MPRLSPPSPAPSPRQAHILRLIAQETASRGVPPTVRELAALARLRSTQSVADLLAALESKGLIRRERSKARTICITAEGQVYASLWTPAKAEGGHRA